MLGTYTLNNNDTRKPDSTRSDKSFSDERVTVECYEDRGRSLPEALADAKESGVCQAKGKFQLSVACTGSGIDSHV